MIPDALYPLSETADDKEAVEVRDRELGITMVYCPECDSMVSVARVAVLHVPGLDHVVHVGYDVSCDHEFTPEESVDTHRERYDYGEDGFAVEVDE